MGTANKKRTDITKEILQQLYIEERKSTVEIAKMFHVNNSTISSKLKNFGIKVRTISEARIRNRVGNRYGKLLVLKHSGKQGCHHKWLCRCDCGNEVDVNSYALTTGVTKSCGCLQIESVIKTNYKGGKYIGLTEFSTIHRNALARSLEFNLEIKDIEDVYETQNCKCNLTGKNIYFNKVTGNNNPDKCGDASVDRIDLSKGYTKNNIQILHKDVNRMKWDFDIEYFKQLCKDIVVYNEL